MSNSPNREGVRGESGFTLIELLVVILIIGILAAIAIPSFLNQRSKAQDAGAKVLVRTAETAAETYSTEHNGEYVGLSPAEVKKIEPTLAEEKTAKLLKAEAGKTGGYIVEVESISTKNTFVIERTSEGKVLRKCSTKGTGACPPSGEW